MNKTNCAWLLAVVAAASVAGMRTEREDAVSGASAPLAGAIPPAGASEPGVGDAEVGVAASYSGAFTSPVDLPTLADRCEYAVVGTVVGMEAYWNEDHDRIYTDIQIAVEEDFKGNFSDATGILTLTELGGTVGETTLLATHTPQFNVGERVLIFTEWTPDGRLIVLGRDQAKFTLVPAPGIELDATGQPVGEPVAASSGSVTAPAAGTALIDHVRELLAERGFRAVSYVIAPGDRLGPTEGSAAPPFEADASEFQGGVALDGTVLAGQCLGGGCTAVGTNYPTGTFSTTSPAWAVVSTCIYAGEYANYSVTSGLTYEWSLCAADGGSASYDSQLTLSNVGNTVRYCYSDDFCGDDAAISWTATFTGTVRVMVNLYSCATNAVCTTLVWRCSSCPRPCNNCAPADSNLGTIGTSVYGYSVAGNCGNGGKWVGQFTGEATYIYHFDLCPDSPGSGTNSAFDPDVKILDSTCTILAGQDGSCSSPSYSPNDFQWTCATSGTYYVIIAPYNSYNSHTCNGSSGHTFTMYYYKAAPVVPNITGVSPNHAPAGVGSTGPTGSLVTITGTNFGTKGANDHMVFWQTGSNYLYNDSYVVSWSDTTITGYVPAGCSSKDCAVYKNGTWSNFYTFTVDWSFWYRWQNQSLMPIAYYINQSTAADRITAARTGIQTWENVAGSYLDHSYRGTTSLTATNQDGYNVISWSNPFGGGSTTIAVTTIWLTSGYITETDMELNAQNFTFTTAGQVAGQVDVQNVVTHEGGHGWCGLSDLYGTPDSEKTMFGTLDVTNGEVKKRDLLAEDIAGCQWIYGTASAPGNDACASAIHIASLPAYVSGKNALATNDYTGSTCDGPYKNMWWRVTGTGNQMIATTCSLNTNFDTEIAVYDACGGSQLTCNDDNNSYCTIVSNSSTVWWCSVAGQTYYISVGSYYSSSSTGSFELQVADTGQVTPTTPTGAIANPTAVCPGGATALSCSAPGAGAVDWFTGGCGTSYVGTGNPLTVYPSSSTTYYARAKNTTSGCYSPGCASVGVTVYVSSTDPSGASANPTAVCPGGATTLSVSGGSLGTGAAWNWYSGTCGGTYVGTGSSIGISPSATTSYFVRAEGTCNATNCASVTVTVKTPSVDPAGGTASPDTICVGGTSTLSVVGGTLGTGAAWQWYAGGCGGTYVASGASINVSPTATTTYYVRAEGDCNATNCASVTLTVGYCAATAANEWEYISNVALVNINNSSGWSAYTDYTALSTDVALGASHAIAVSIGSFYAADLCDAYVDWNRNCIFESGEKTALTWNGTSAFTGSLSVPGGVSYGTARLRVHLWDDSANPGAGPCGATAYGETEDYTVNVVCTTAPAAAASDRNNLCADDSGNISLSVTGGAGATARWFDDSCGGNSIGTGNPLVIASPTATTAYYARWENACGNSGCASVTVIVNPSPADPTNGQASPASICAGASASISATVGGGEVLDWYADSCGGTWVDTGNPLAVAPGVTTTYYGRARNSSSGCVSSGCVTVTVIVSETPANDVCANATPVTVGTPVSGNTAVCATTDAAPTCGTSISAPGLWYAVAGTGNQMTASLCGGATWDTKLNIYADGCGTLTCVTGVDDACGGLQSEVSWCSSNGQQYLVLVQGYGGATGPFTLSVSETAAPTAPTGAWASENPACPGSSIYLNATGGSGGTLTWYVGGCGSGSTIGTGSQIGILVPAVETTYYVRVEASCGIASSCAAVTLGINPPADAPDNASATPSTACYGDTVTLTATGYSGGVIRWYANMCGGSALYQGDTYTFSAPPATTTYFARTEGPCGMSGCASTTLTIDPAVVMPDSVSANPNPACAGQTVTLTAAGGSGGTLTWYSGNCPGGTLIGTGNPIQITAPSSDTIYLARIEGPCGESMCRWTNLTVTPGPTAPTGAAVVPSAACPGTPLTLSATGASGGTLAWYAGGCGTGSPIGSGSPLVITAPASDTTYYARIEGTCGNSGCASAAFTAWSSPTAPASASVDRDWFCTGDTGTIGLSVAGGSGTTCRWFATSCGGTEVGTGSPLVLASPPVTTSYYARWETACGTSTCVAVTAHVDETGPSFTGIPNDVSVYCDAGYCYATDTTVGQATATDDHNGVANVVATLSDDSPLPTQWSPGVYQIKWTATDGCGNTTVDATTQQVTVIDQNELLVDVQLRGGVVSPLDRCITFTLHDCGGATKTVESVITFTGGAAYSVALAVDCGDYDCILAQNELHTLTRRLDRGAGLNVVAKKYVASFTASSNDLIGGDLYDDEWIDIVDFGTYIAQWGQTYGATTCATSPPHADVNGDSVLDATDFGFISSNYWMEGSWSCCTDGPRGAPHSSLTRAELVALHLPLWIDLNGDGVFDPTDVNLFASGERPVSDYAPYESPSTPGPAVPLPYYWP